LKLRGYRPFASVASSHRRDRTGWLGRQDSEPGNGGIKIRSRRRQEPVSLKAARPRHEQLGEMLNSTLRLRHLVDKALHCTL
jgi:hypothetical protein